MYECKVIGDYCLIEEEWLTCLIQLELKLGRVKS